MRGEGWWSRRLARPTDSVSDQKRNNAGQKARGHTLVTWSVTTHARGISTTRTATKATTHGLLIPRLIDLLFEFFELCLCSADCGVEHVDEDGVVDDDVGDVFDPGEGVGFLGVGWGHGVSFRGVPDMSVGVYRVSVSLCEIEGVLTFLVRFF